MQFSQHAKQDHAICKTSIVQLKKTPCIAIKQTCKICEINVINNNSEDYQNVTEIAWHLRLESQNAGDFCCHGLQQNVIAWRSHLESLAWLV